MGHSKAIFNLELRPNRSLDRRQFKLMIAAVAFIFLLMGLRFLFLGAWLILPFMLADIALLVWAMRTSYASAQESEHLRLDENGLELLRLKGQHPARRTRIEPLWAQVELETFPDKSNRLWLRAGQNRYAIGSFLSAPERAELARVIEDGLRRYRGR